MLSDFQVKLEQIFAFHLSLIKSVPTVETLSKEQKCLEQKVIEDTVCKELQIAINTGIQFL